MSVDGQNKSPIGAKIKVVGVGGGGGNAVNTMISKGIQGVEFIVCNTDIQSLDHSLADIKIQVGKSLTKGLGAGAEPDVGREAALEDKDEIRQAIGDADMVFITAGMGGGTGTGGAPVVAEIARELGALTVAVVTKPFGFEGKRRWKHSELGSARLKESVDTLISIPNQRLLDIATPDTSMLDAFKLADDVLVNAVKGISDIIIVPGTVNVDFADVRTVMANRGLALIGIGEAEGENRATVAADQAISSPLLEDINIDGATGILITVTSGSNLSLMEVNEACSIVQEAAHEDANVIFGAVIDEKMENRMRITVIATGFEPSEVDSFDKPKRRPSRHEPAINRSFQVNTKTNDNAGQAAFQAPEAPKSESLPNAQDLAMQAIETKPEASMLMGARVENTPKLPFELTTPKKADSKIDNLDIPAFLRNGLSDLPKD